MLCGAHHHPPPPAASLIWPAREKIGKCPPAASFAVSRSLQRRMASGAAHRPRPLSEACERPIKDKKIRLGWRRCCVAPYNNGLGGILRSSSYRRIRSAAVAPAG